MKLIALTGSTGVLGTRIQQYFQDAKFYIFDGDIRDTDAVKAFCRESVVCDAFLHLAARVPKQLVDSNPMEAFDINVRGTLNILEGLKSLGKHAPWFFYASSSHVYASSKEPINEHSQLNPFTLYGLTKLQGEAWCQAYAREYELPVCIGRFFSFSDVLQSNLYFIPAMIHKIRIAEKNATLELFGINGQRDFVTVTQICQTLNLLLTKRFTGIINIGTGEGNHLLTIINKIKTLLGRNDLNIIAKNDEPNYLVADVARLKNLEGTLPNNIDLLLEEMVNNS